jgi:hypothetical protein
VYVQLLLLHYFQDLDHPVLQLFKQCPEIFIGEDIELGNRYLSQFSKNDSRRSNYDLLNRAYQSLGLMLHSGVILDDENEEIKGFTKGNRRYQLQENIGTMKKIKEYWEEVVVELGNGTWHHYKIPRDPIRKTRAQPSPPEMDPNNYRTMVLYSNNTLSKSSEDKKRELIDVPLLASSPWFDNIKKKVHKFWTKKWDFFQNVKKETLQEFLATLPKYAAPD